MGRLVDYLSALIIQIDGKCDAAEARLKTLAIVGQALVVPGRPRDAAPRDRLAEVDTGGARRFGASSVPTTRAILTSNRGDSEP